MYVGEFFIGRKKVFWEFWVEGALMFKKNLGFP